VLQVDKVYHRDDAVWPLTVVGRPPQEDTVFGELIHELTGPIIPTVLPGVKAVHAVDAAGVHPLLLAIGSERYVPWDKSAAPQELLTQAHAILGQGQLSLAKYLWILDEASAPDLNIQDIAGFFQRMLERVDWCRDLHFQTHTTIDTLDYTGSGMNAGSKVVIAATGPRRRELPTALPAGIHLPDGFSHPRVALPGVLVVQGPPCRLAESVRGESPPQLASFCAAFNRESSICDFPLVVLADDSEFTAHNISNLVWVMFTRSNPATDIEGIESFTEHKHWGCLGSLVVDARIKPHHAPPLIEDPQIVKRVDALAAGNHPLSKYL